MTKLTETLEYIEEAHNQLFNLMIGVDEVPVKDLVQVRDNLMAAKLRLRSAITEAVG